MVSAVAVAVLAVQAFDAARRPSVVREQEPGRHARAHARAQQAHGRQTSGNISATFWQTSGEFGSFSNLSALISKYAFCRLK